jgi:DNA-binding GntR family transcriptional regulator
MSSDGQRGESQAERVLRHMQDDILAGRLSGGSRLRISELAHRYSVAAGTVREVLPRLEANALVVSRPNSGYRVVTRTKADMDQLVAARLLLEPECLRQAILAGDLTWEGRVVAALHRLERTEPFNESNQVSDEWHHEHLEFHSVLLEACENKYLVGAANRWRNAALLYRLTAASLTHRRGQFEREHRELVRLATQRDAAGAVTCLRAHIGHSAAILTELESHSLDQD